MLQLKEGLNKYAFKMQNEHFIDHGYYSALIVLRWYYYLIQKAQWNPAYFYYPIVDSASAILLHNYYRQGLMKPPYNLGKLDVEKHPLAYLLILCDELQDWKRAAYGEVDKKISLPIDFSILIANDKLELSYITDGSDLPNDYVKKKNHAISEVLETNYLFSKGISINVRKGV